MGRGRGRGPQAETSGVQGRVYAVTPRAESVDQPVIQGTFLLSRLWARVLFGTRGVNIRSVSRPREGQGSDELGEAEVSLQDT